MPQAHPRALAASTGKIVGQSEAIGSGSLQGNGPILVHQQRLWKNIIGPLMQLAVGSENAMGPS